jgi:hypothetical protein
MRGQGSTWLATADKLNTDGHETRRGCTWSAPSVYQLAKHTCGRVAACDVPTILLTRLLCFL